MRAGPLAAYVVGAVLVLSAVAVAVMYAVRDEPGTASRAESSAPPVRDLTTMTPAQSERLRALRDEALECMGWAAGNSFRRARWPEVESFVGQRGVYYDWFMALGPPGLPSDLREAESAANLARYRDAFARGRAEPLDEGEVTRCIERAITISAELEALLEAVSPPESLGSRVFPE